MCIHSEELISKDAEGFISKKKDILKLEKKDYCAKRINVFTWICNTVGTCNITWSLFNIALYNIIFILITLTKRDVHILPVPFVASSHDSLEIMPLLWASFDALGLNLLFSIKISCSKAVSRSAMTKWIGVKWRCYEMD